MMLTRWLPKTLAGRMALILIAGLLVSQAISLALHWHDRASLMDAGHGHPGTATLEPLPMKFVWHVTLTLIAVIAVSLIAVRWATQPLQQFATAAHRFADDIDAPPLPETGPLEVRRAAEAFNFMQGRLRRLIVERSRALAAVSHDLRTPLTRMRLRAELVEDAALQQKLNADIDIMQSMVNAVLAYLRGLEDKEPVQAINMGALLYSIVEDERSLGRPVELLGCTPSAQPPQPYVGRLSVLRRAVSNLIDNAVRHGRLVHVSIDDAPTELRVAVEDDGPGIPDADLARVTEPFVRLDASRSLETGGVGLGLAIVSDAAASHGGRLILENRAAGGLRALLVLPRAAFGEQAVAGKPSRTDGAS
jgi:signal transduction histidine kinase